MILLQKIHRDFIQIKKPQIKISQQKFKPYSATIATYNSLCRTLHKFLANAEHCRIN